MKYGAILLLSAAFHVGIRPVAFVYAAGEQPYAVTIILDCSRSMAESAGSASADAQPPTENGQSRFDVAKRATLQLLTRLSGQGHQVGLVLYGHRLGWEQGVEDPDLVEQIDYLGNTNSFQVLSSLTPGDDVETVLGPGRLSDQEFERLRLRAELLRPWGEKPLHLAISQALDYYIRKRHDVNPLVIVLTDGGDRQGLARVRRGRDEVIATARRRGVPVHVIGVGLDESENSDDVHELRSLATATDGEIHLESTAERILDSVADIVRPAPTQEKELPVNIVRDARDGSVKPVAQRPPPVEITGAVTYYGRPVRNADVTLQGEVERIVKTDREGKFIFREVPPGKYAITANGIAKNAFRKNKLEIAVKSNSGKSAHLNIEVR